jgi:inner membrane protein
MDHPSQNPGAFDRAGQWLSNSITLRLLVIGILILIMLIPVSMIEGLISERQFRQTEAQQEIADTWGHPQTIGGVVVSVPYTSYSRVTRENGKEETVASLAWYHFLPDMLDISAKLDPEVRYRGIFETIVYSAVMQINGQFRLNSESFKPGNGLRWNEAVISIGISDLRSIQENVNIKLGDTTYAFNPGLPGYDVFESGISVPVQIKPDQDGVTTLPFALNLDLRGSEYLHFLPLGKTTTVYTSSSWKSPSFTGAFLPLTREVNDQGFSANWKVLNLNRPYPQEFSGSIAGIQPSAFGVNLLLPVDHYQKSTRAAKYAVLFITLTFVVFFFIQIMGRIRIHPVQYILVGFALCMFYTLLISLSEHLRFAWAYLIAASGIVLLISIYAHGAFRNIRLTGILSAIMVLLYGFIFSIIQLQDLALLVGSIGLFLALAVIMYTTRKIDWYQASQFNAKRSNDSSR